MAFSDLADIRLEPTRARARADLDRPEIERIGDMAVAVPEGWRGGRGATLAGETLRLRFAGNPSGPALLALGGISADRFVADEGGDEGGDKRGDEGGDERGAEGGGARGGWWRGLAARGAPIDLDRHCVIGLDYPPLRPRGDIDLTTADYADLIRTVLACVGVSRLDAVIGASFGGMIALALAERHAEFLGRIAVLCAAHRPSPMAQAQREIQRRILRLGLERGAAREAVAIARGLAMTSYRTAEEFAARFDHRLGSPRSAGAYLAARGEAYAATMTARRYLALSTAIDRHEAVPENIAAPALFVAADSDRLVPLRDMADMQQRYGGPSRLVVLPTPYGHDAFLKETAAIAPHLREFLKEPA